MALMTIRNLIAGSLILYFSTFMATKLYIFLVSRGVGVAIFNHYPGKCRIVPGIECGSEDTAVTKNGLTFLSSGYRGITGCDMKTLRGGLYIFDFKNPDANAMKLDIISDTINMEEFEPHGLSLWEEDDKILLFAVDHGVSERIQVFEYDPKHPTQLAHKKTIIDKEFVCINDVVALDENRFYVTNYLKYCKVWRPLTIMEAALALRTGNVVFFDGSKGRVVVSDLGMPNGINISPDGRHIYVAASSAESLYVFSRNSENASLTMLNEIGLSSFPDNVEVDKDTGDLYIACHRNQKLILADYNGPFAAPSQVLRVRPIDAEWNECTITEILSSDGHDFVRGSSVAKYVKGKLLIGTVFHKLALCEDVNVL